MSDQNLIVLTGIAGLRSNGKVLKLVRTRSGKEQLVWEPKTAKPTADEMQFLKKHRKAIIAVLRGSEPTTDDAAGGGAADEDHRRASNAAGVSPLVSSGDCSSPTSSDRRHLDADGNKKPTLSPDEQLRRTNPAAWRIVHGNEDAVVAEQNAELTRVMYRTVGTPSRFL